MTRHGRGGINTALGLVVIAAGQAVAAYSQEVPQGGADAESSLGPAIRHPSGRNAGPLRFDCVAGAPGCPAFEPIGDAPDVLPGGGPSPFRGFADPSIRLDPVSGRLWMGYTWPHVEIAPASWLGVVGTPDIHLAVSDDGGVS